MPKQTHHHNYSTSFFAEGKKFKKCRCGKRQPYHSVLIGKIKSWPRNELRHWPILIALIIISTSVMGVIWFKGIYENKKINGGYDLSNIRNSGKLMGHVQSNGKDFRITGTKTQNIKEEVLQMFEKEGLNSDIADCVCFAESNYNQYAINKNNNGTYDLGLWQINDINKVPREISFNYKKATEWTIAKVKRDKGWGAWYGFNAKDCGRFGNTFK